MNSDEFNILRKLRAMHMCQATTVSPLGPLNPLENENIAVKVFLSSGNCQLPFKFAEDV